MSQFQDAREDESTMSVGHKLFIISTWVFPFLLAAAAYLIGTFYEPASALKTSTQTWPIPDSVYLWLLIFVLITATWLLAEFLSVTNRETVIAALQLDVMISSLTALLFTAFGGWLIGTKSLEWWYIVPWAATVADNLIAGWLSVNNAAQKPFLSKKGTE